MNPDRIFVDANILFSVAYGSSGLSRLWELAKEHRCRLFASDYVVEEARRNLIHAEHLEKLEAYLSNVQIIYEIAPQIPCPIELPMKNRPILLSAIFIKANYLITGDEIHFGKYFGKTVSGVKICRPRDYFNYQQRKIKRK